MTSSLRLSFTLAVGTALAAGCGSEPLPTTGEGGTGTIEMALTSMSGSTSYVLANATFLVERIQPPPAPGDITGIRLHSSDTTTGDLVASLEVGRYNVTLLDGWQIERADSATSLVPLQATLQSANPATVSIFSGQTTTVTFQFQTNGMPLTFAPGSIDINVGVGTCDPAAPPGSELNVVANPGFEVNTDGWSSQIVLSDEAHCGRHSGAAMSAGSGLTYALPHPEISTTYDVSAWVRHTIPASLGPGITLTLSGSPADKCQAIKGSFGVAPSVWTRISAMGSVGGPDCTNVSLVIAADSWDATSEVELDDVYVIPR